MLERGMKSPRYMPAPHPNGWKAFSCPGGGPPSKSDLAPAYVRPSSSYSIYTYTSIIDDKLPETNSNIYFHFVATRFFVDFVETQNGSRTIFVPRIMEIGFSLYVLILLQSNLYWYLNYYGVGIQFLLWKMQQVWFIGILISRKLLP